MRSVHLTSSVCIPILSRTSIRGLLFATLCWSHELSWWAQINLALFPDQVKIKVVVRKISPNLGSFRYLGFNWTSLMTQPWLSRGLFSPCAGSKHRPRLCVFSLGWGVKDFLFTPVSGRFGYVDTSCMCYHSSVGTGKRREADLIRRQFSRLFISMFWEDYRIWIGAPIRSRSELVTYFIHKVVILTG